MVIYGDINGDGKITLEDLILIKSHIAGILTLTGDALLAADVNGDGVIDQIDATMIEYHIQGRFIINKVV